MSLKHNFALLAAFSFLVLLLQTVSWVVAQNISIERVMVASDGTLANRTAAGGFYSVAISADGRYTAFVSVATNLVPDDTNHYEDVFVHDRETGVTERVSVSSSGQQGHLPPVNSDYITLVISDDGRFVVFSSRQSCITYIENEKNDGISDIFVRDRLNGTTSLVSAGLNGEKANGFSEKPCISADARYIGFHSAASNLVDDDTNNTVDTFLYDRMLGTTTRVSVSSTGQQGNGISNYCSVSGDGNTIAFQSKASNLAGNVNGSPQNVFVHYRLTGETFLISASPEGEAGNNYSGSAALSANGRYLAFLSSANNLVANDTNDEADIFVHDLFTGHTIRGNVSSTGQESNGISSQVDISANGRFIAYVSEASNLVLNDTNNEFDVFVHDLLTGKTRRASVSSSGQQGNGDSAGAALSNDGHWVAFISNATNLVPPFSPELYFAEVFEAEMPWYDIISPSNAAPNLNYFTEFPIVLTWTEVTVAASYEVQIASSPNFIAPMSISASQLNTSIHSLNDGVYYWRVRAKNIDGIPGVWSAVEQFEVDVIQ